MNVWCQNGWKTVWDTVVAGGKLPRIRLFKNNYTPVNSSTYADFTEADFSGYAGYASLSWGAAFINGSTQGEIDATQVTWTHNGGGTANTVYGIYITDGSNNLMYAERFSAPISMSTSGNAIPYTAKTTDLNQ